MVSDPIETLIRTLCVLLAAYEPTGVQALHEYETTAYSAGFRAGARATYMDCIMRLRELKADAAACRNAEVDSALDRLIGGAA